VSMRNPERVDNFVLPVVSLKQRGDELAYTGFCGTAFLLAGAGGHAMTARHVAEKAVVGQSAVLFVSENGTWEAAAIQGVELHPTEDVALVRLEPGDYQSPLVLSRSQEYASGQYMLWGYPEAVLFDRADAGGASPDLVYSEGHIRRCITHDLPGLRGRTFFELSTPAGAGCSGSPVTMRRPGMQWQVVGVYTGERRSDSGDFAVGFATRAADLDEGLPNWSALWG
jgi:Trypsin-like peptidase domain